MSSFFNYFYTFTTKRVWCLDDTYLVILYNTILSDVLSLYYARNWSGTKGSIKEGSVDWLPNKETFGSEVRIGLPIREHVSSNSQESKVNDVTIFIIDKGNDLSLEDASSWS